MLSNNNMINEIKQELQKLQKQQDEYNAACNVQIQKAGALYRPIRQLQSKLCFADGIFQGKEFEVTKIP